MPYIGKDRRGHTPNVAGELNFAITTLINDYIRRRGVCYQTFNDIVGVLECQKLELYRRVVAPYENKKITENGDAYSIGDSHEPKG